FILRKKAGRRYNKRDWRGEKGRTHQHFSAGLAFGPRDLLPCRSPTTIFTNQTRREIATGAWGPYKARKGPAWKLRCAISSVSNLLSPAAAAPLPSSWPCAP